MPRTEAWSFIASSQSELLFLWVSHWQSSLIKCAAVIEDFSNYRYQHYPRGCYDWRVSYQPTESWSGSPLRKTRVFWIICLTRKVEFAIVRSSFTSLYSKRQALILYCSPDSVPIVWPHCSRLHEPQWVHAHYIVINIPEVWWKRKRYTVPLTVNLTNECE